MDKDTLIRFIKAEVTAINRTLQAHGVDAGCMPNETLVGGRSLILYRVRRGRGVRIADVGRLVPELGEAVSELRGTRTPVRLQTAPMALELPHPRPAPLTIDPDRLFDLQPGIMLAGRSYGHSGAQDELIDLDHYPHTLIAGTTGAGKSVLLRTMLLSLAAGTPPSAARLVLVDLKNEDLRPLARLKLPHVVTYAGDPEAAAQAVALVHAEKERRRDTGDRPYRLILAIDELAELATSGQTMEQLSSLLALGRSLQINVIAATQHPTAKMLGGLARVNFSVRLCGLVIDANTASVATGRPHTGAERLPGRGAFLRIAGPELIRFQSYYMDPEAFGWGVRKARARWGGVEPAGVDVASNGVEEAQPAPQEEEIPPELLNLIEEYRADDGTLRRGFMTRAVTVINGGVEPTGNAFRRAREEVNRYVDRFLPSVP